MKIHSVKKALYLYCHHPYINKNINYTVNTFIKYENEEKKEDKRTLKFNFGKLSQRIYIKKNLILILF
jgi:hypothetical protein